MHAYLIFRHSYLFIAIGLVCIIRELMKFIFAHFISCLYISLETIECI